MSLKEIERSLAGSCPACLVSIVPSGDIEESEILVCPDCQSQLKVEFIQNNGLVLSLASEVEEDWYE